MSRRILEGVKFISDLPHVTPRSAAEPTGQPATTNKAIDLMNGLPVELTRQVLSFLQQEDLARCFRVCRLWKSVAENDRLWLHLCLDGADGAIASMAARKSHESLRRRLRLATSLSIQQTPFASLPFLFQETQSLQQLSLHGLRHLDCETLIQYFTHPNTSLLEVSLQRSHINDRVVACLLGHHASTLSTLDLAFTPINDLSLECISASNCLKSLSLAACFNLSAKGVRRFLVSTSPKTIVQLDLRQLHYIHSGWIDSFIHLNESLRSVDITGCDEVTRQDIRRLVHQRPDLEVRHLAKLEEHSAWGYAQYIKSITS